MKKLMGLYFLVSLFILISCGDKLELKLNSKEIDMNERGSFVVRGSVKGKGNFYLDAKKVNALVDKDGLFEIIANTKNITDTKVNIEYGDSKNKLHETVVIKANPDRVKQYKYEKRCKEEDEKRKKEEDNKRIEEERINKELEEKKKKEEEIRQNNIKMKQQQEQEGREKIVSNKFSNIIELGEGLIVSIKPQDEKDTIVTDNYRVIIKDEIKYADKNSRHLLLDTTAQAIQNTIMTVTSDDAPWVSFWYEESGLRAASSQFFDKTILKYYD